MKFPYYSNFNRPGCCRSDPSKLNPDQSRGQVRPWESGEAIPAVSKNVRDSYQILYRADFFLSIGFDLKVSWSSGSRNHFLCF